MRKKLLFTLLCYTLLVTGCSSANSTTSEVANDSYAAEGVYDSGYYDESYESSEMMKEDAEAEQVTESGAQKTESNRKLITTMNLDVETDQFEKTTVTIVNKANELGGYVENSSVYGNGLYSEGMGNRSADYTIRIPQEKLSQFLDVVEEGTNITRKTENVEDVTLSYVDLQSHKSALVAEEKQLLSLMEQATDIETILQIQNELTNVRYQIESMESQLRTYDNKINYATVNLNVSEVVKYTPVEKETMGSRIVNGFVENFGNVVDGICEFIIWFITHIPQLVVFAVIIFVIVKICKWISKRGKKKLEKQNLGRVKTDKITKKDDKKDSETDEKKDTEKTEEAVETKLTKDNIDL